MEKKDSRSLWKRVKETIQTIKPVEPGSYKARSLSIEAQRDNAINWLSKQPYKERKSEGFGSDIPDHLLKDQEFARELHERFGEKVADRVIPLEVRRSAEYQAATTENYSFLNAALKHDEVALQLPTKDHSEHFSETDKLHAIETVRRMGPEEAADFLIREVQPENAKAALKAMSDEVLTNKDFLLAIDGAGVDLHALPEHIRSNDELMGECVKDSPFFFEVASKDVRDNKQFFESALDAKDKVSLSHEKHDRLEEQAARNYSRASIGIRAEPDYFCVSNYQSWGQVAVRDVPDSLRNNKKFIEDELRMAPSALRYASRDLRKDRQFILDMTERYKIDVPRADLIKDRDIAANLARTDSVQLHNLPDDLKNDRDFVAQVVKLNPEQLEYAKPEFQDDYEIAYNAVSQKSDRYAALEHCSSRLQADPSIVYKAVESNGYNIIYANHDLQDNFAMGMHVVQNEPWAVECLSINLRNNLEIAKEVIAREPSASTELGDELKKNLIASLSPEDKAQYEHWFTENEPDLAGRYIAKGLEPYLIKLEREELETLVPKVEATQAPTLTAEQSVNKLLSDVLASPDLGVSSKPSATAVAQANAPTQSASPKRKFKI